MGLQVESLHASESGVPQLHKTAGPRDYARNIARYISCPSTVRARTLNEYGSAPSLDEIRQMRAEHEGRRDAFRRASDKLEPFKVRRRASIIPEPKPRQPIDFEIDCVALPNEIISAIARHFGFTAADLIGKRRHDDVVQARNTAAYVLWTRGNSYARVGRRLGGRDHSTIIHSCRNFERHATPEMRDVAARFIGCAA
jgi:hypothetical protein